MNRLIVFSAAQPSGALTIGNYIGAICQWVKMQDKYQCMYCIADLHSITSCNNLLNLKETSLTTLALYLACGLDPDNSIIFVQSHVSEHSELYWLLSCYTYFGELNRMVQFKEKSVHNKSGVNVGVLNYPVLMAADILLYQTNLVPVGEDQKQHLELVRSIAKRFNRIYGSIFTIPDIFIPNVGSKIMSLLDPQRKMSKSDFNVNNVIKLLDKANMVEKKIFRSVTDSDQPPIIRYDPVSKPGVSNLLEILSRCTEQPMTYLEQVLQGKTYFQLKCKVIESLVPILMRLQNRYVIERSDEYKLYRILRDGAKRARIRARDTIDKVYDIMGFF